MSDRLSALFADREIFLRSHGEIRFLRISARSQKIAAAALAVALLLWGGVTLSMLYRQASVTLDQRALEAQQRALSGEARSVNRYKQGIDSIAQDVARRQDILDDMARSAMGQQPDGRAVVGSEKNPDPDRKTSQADETVGPASIHKLRALEARQTALAHRFASLINQRASRAEQAIRSFGVDPRLMLRRPAAQGGPFIPWSREAAELDASFSQLADALQRLNALERGLAMLPSGRPTMSPSLTSSYGYRRDPFTGAAAFHAGLDFPGAYGQPILAAAPGRVSYAGGRSGYGNCIEIDHGNGIMTRYAHLSGIGVRMGQMVPKGFQIGRMGSTGRSTGTHLHFEVRINNAPINPRRFLEADQNVLQVQQIAGNRVAHVRG